MLIRTMLIRTIRIRIMRTLTFFLTLLMATALQAQPLLDEASSTLQPWPHPIRPAPR